MDARTTGRHGSKLRRIGLYAMEAASAPLRLFAEAQAEPPASVAMRVLVVDDVPDILRVFQGIVLRAMPGASVAVEEDSRAAVRRLESEPFDLVVADLRMPEVNGLDVLTFARARCPRARRILMSGHYEPIIDEVFLRGYALDAFIHKPFHVPMIVRYLRLLAAGAGEGSPVIISPREAREEET